MTLIRTPYIFWTVAPGTNVSLNDMDSDFDTILNALNGNLDAINVPDLNGLELDLPISPLDGDWLMSQTDGTRGYLAPTGAPVPSNIFRTIPTGFSNSQLFTANGTWTRPGGITQVYIYAWSGGGGGGGGAVYAANSYSGGGGASGAYGEGWFINITGNIAVVVGQGGSGGAAGPGIGFLGGTSTGGTGSTGGTTTVSGGGLPSGISITGGRGGTGGFASSSAPGHGGTGGAVGAIAGLPNNDHLGNAGGNGAANTTGGVGGSLGYSSYNDKGGNGGYGSGSNQTGQAGLRGQVLIKW